MPTNAAQPFVTEYRFDDDGSTPNNKSLPMLIYKKAVPLGGDDPAAAFEGIFEQNGWSDSWRDSIYDYQHYHSTAHEVMGVANGRAKVLFGGDHGLTLEIEAGDVVVIPAGVGHKNLGSSPDFMVVGAYPKGQKVDMNTGKPGEHEKALEKIGQVPLPSADPVQGTSGPLIEYWRALP